MRSSSPLQSLAGSGRESGNPKRISYDDKVQVLWSASRDRDTNQGSAQSGILFKLLALAEMDS